MRPYKGTAYRAMSINTSADLVLRPGANVFLDLNVCFRSLLNRRQVNLIIFYTKDNPPRAHLPLYREAVIRSTWPLREWKPFPRDKFKKMIEDVHVAYVERALERAEQHVVGRPVRFVNPSERKYREFEASALRRLETLLDKYPEWE